MYKKLSRKNFPKINLVYLYLIEKERERETKSKKEERKMTE